MTDACLMRKMKLLNMFFLQAPERAVVGEEFEVELIAHNILTQKITNCSFSIEAPGIVTSKTIPHK